VRSRGCGVRQAGRVHRRRRLRQDRNAVEGFDEPGDDALMGCVDPTTVTGLHPGLTDDDGGVIDHRIPVIDASWRCVRYRIPVIDDCPALIAGSVPARR